MLNYQTTGAGKTIVFIHGLSQSADIWYLLKNNPVFDGYRIIFIDMPGHGGSFRSAEPEKDYSMKGMAGHLKSALKETGVDEYLVVASSLATCLMGEIIPQLRGCKGLFFIGACPVGNMYPVEAIVKPNPYFGVTFTGEPDDEALSDYINSLGTDLDPAVTERCRAIFRSTDPKCREEMGKSVGNRDWSDEVAHLEGFPFPVALVYGAGEAVINPHYLENSAIKKWRDTIILIPGSGHCCYLDKPKETALLIAAYAGEAFS